MHPFRCRIPEIEALEWLLQRRIFLVIINVVYYLWKDRNSRMLNWGAEI